MTVKAGDTVVWVNKDPVPHTVTSQAGGCDSPEIAPGSLGRLHELLTLPHYVDNNSTPIMSSKLFEVQCFLALSSGSRSAMPSALLLCATIVDLSCGYWRQYHLLTPSASGALNGVRCQKEL